MSDSIYDRIIQNRMQSEALARLTSEASINPNLASEFHKRLIKWINDFDSTLDQEHEVGVRLVSFGQTVVFHLFDISYWNPSLISFIGITNDGEPVELIQHISQISILLMKLKRLDTSKPKRKIGFRSENTEKED
ncbi:MAG: DUF6173 family protein [Pyrinomonadaceae bacterium]